MDTAAAAETPLAFDEDENMRDTRIEQLLQSWNLGFELDLTFPLARLKLEEVTQIRSEAHRAPKSTVEQYVTHMRHGAIFPPIVIASNALLVDGNARVEACKVLNRKSFPAYKVKFPQLGMAKMVGAALNQMGGDRLSDEEIIIAAEAMMQNGYGDDSIARTLGRSISHVRNVRRERSFRETAERTGVAEARLSKQVQRILAGIQHDEPFKAAVELVTLANPSTKDISTLVNQVEKTRSDAEALAHIETLKQQWGPVTGPPPTPKRFVERQPRQEGPAARQSPGGIPRHARRSRDAWG